MYDIETKNLVKKYGELTAVNNVNFLVEEKSLFGLLGVNGAGKTTLIKMLTCLSVPTSGKAFVGGFEISESPDKIKEITDVSPQETAVAPNLTVEENLKFFAEIYGITDENHIKNIINSFSLNEVLNQKAKTLSGGWKRRLSIAIGLISKPKILFLDEPTLGLDVIARRELWKIIRLLKGKITIILTTHYLEEAEALCDKVAIMAKGNVMATGTAEELKKIAKTDNFEDAFIKIAESEV